MNTIDVRELTEHINDLIRLLRDKGESIELVDQGQVIGRIVPAKKEGPTREEAQAFLKALEDVSAEISAHITEQVDAVQIIKEGRREL